jgi:uncharacterized protein YjiS (DUF1127 family)
MIMATTARAPGVVASAPPWLRRTADLLGRAWGAYWERRARHAAVLLLRSLDERTLRDMGVTRGEIESVVYGAPRERRRSYCPSGCS